MTLQEFKDKMRSVFCEGSGISPDLFEQFEFLNDIETDRCSGEWYTPIHDTLGWEYKPFKQVAHQDYALILKNEDGRTWQVVLSDRNDERGYKYLAPEGNGNKAFTPPIPVLIRQKISDRNGVEVPLTGSFWDWYRDHPDVNLVPTEGGKKALASLTDGFVSIAVYGATCLKSPDLIPYLKDRNVAIALDSDTKASAIETVSQGKRAGDWFARKNGAKSVIWVDWNPEDGKGLDDLKVAGILVSVLEEAFNNFGDPDLQGGKPHFWSTPDRGLVWESYKKDEETGIFKRATETIGNHLQAIAYVDNVERNGASIYIEFKTIRNRIAYWVLPRKDLLGKSELINELLARGYWFRLEERAKLSKYLVGLGGDTEQTYTITDRTGWVDRSFVLPNRTYGDETLRFKEIEPIKDSAFECKGTLEDWKFNVATLATGNSRLIFALGCALSAPLAPLLEVESGGFHLFGATSTGKTSTLKLASSVMGIPSKAIQRWRATANGLEGLAVAHNHLLLPLDEIGQADARDVGNAAYMLANGQGKTRANKTGDRIVPKTWNLQYLSTGEITLTNYLKSANITVKGGQEIRMLDLPACPVKGFGVLESFSKFASAADFIHALDTNCDRYCGTALDAYLKQLTQDAQLPEWVNKTKSRLWEIARGLSKVAPSDEVIGRVSLRFALVQTALEVTHSYGLLPFPIEQIEWAIATMQTDWLNTRGGVGSLEMKQALERIENLFVVHQHSDRIYQVGETETNQVVRNLLAYRKLDTFTQAFEFWVPNAVFNSEIAKDCDRTELIQELQRKGWLKPSGADGKPYLGRRVNGKFTRVYVFTQFWSDENLGTDFEVLTKLQVSEVSQVSDTQNSHEYTVSPDTLDGYHTGISRYQRYQQDNLETNTKDVIPVIPSENLTGITEVLDKSIDNKGFSCVDTSDTCDTHQNINTLKIGSQVKYLGTEHKLAQDKKLTIVSIDGDIAKVTYPSWIIEQPVALSELVEYF